MRDVGHNLLIKAHYTISPQNKVQHTEGKQAYQDSCHEGSSVGRGEKAKTSKDESDEGHEEDLSTTSHAHRQQHCGSWGSENITMY
jgi:hypothetical protein